jgi:hypothetical protein
MKVFATIGAAGLAVAACLGPRAEAATPAYRSFSAAGNATTGATALLPALPGNQIRLVSVQWQSDSNTAVLQFQTGVGQYTLTATNTSSGVTQVVASTAGIVTNSLLVLQRDGTPYAATIVQTNNGTNIVLGTGAWGVAPQIGDNVYQLGPTNSVPIGATTNWQNGEALYVGNLGRPLRLCLTPALVTNRLTSITARYE